MQLVWKDRTCSIILLEDPCMNEQENKFRSRYTSRIRNYANKVRNNSTRSPSTCLAEAMVEYKHIPQLDQVGIHCTELEQNEKFEFERFPEATPVPEKEDEEASHAQKTSTEKTEMSNSAASEEINITESTS